MKDFSLWGAIVNTLAVILGSAIGLLIKRFFAGRKVNQTGELSDTVLKGLALGVLGIGITGAIKAAVNGQIADALAGSHVGDPEATLQLVSGLVREETLIVVMSLALGAAIGHFLRLDQAVNALGERVEGLTRSRFGNVAEGFVSASLLFCVGSMTIVGALNSGLTGDHSMLYTKSILDFVSSILFAMSMGFGVLFSAGFVFVLEGSIAILAQWISPFLGEAVISCMSGVGSLLIIGLALNVLGVTKLKIMNYTPAIFLPIALIPLSQWLISLA